MWRDVCNVLYVVIDIIHPRIYGLGVLFRTDILVNRTPVDVKSENI